MQSRTKRVIIYARYVLPVVMVPVLFILMLVPYIRFKDTDGLKGAVSLVELIGNSWETVTEYMFGMANTNAVTLDFARTVMAVIIIFAVMFIIGAASAVYALISAIIYFKDSTKIKQRVLFITLTGNRIVLCAFHSLMLGIFLFPTVLPYFYGKILSYGVITVYTPFNMFYLAIAFYAITVALVIISKRYEMSDKMNIYTRAVVHEQPCIDIDEHEEEELDAYALMNKKAKEEQAEKIRRLLLKNQDTDEDK